MGAHPAGPVHRAASQRRPGRNLAYGDAGKRNLLDVYHRRDRPLGGPALVYFHGGDFRVGHKRWEGRALLHHLAARGWCV